MKLTHILFVILVFALVIGLAGCRKAHVTEKPAAEEEAGAVEEPLSIGNISDTGVDIEDTDTDVSDLEDVLNEI